MYPANSGWGNLTGRLRRPAQPGNVTRRLWRFPGTHAGRPGDIRALPRVTSLTFGRTRGHPWVPGWENLTRVALETPTPASFVGAISGCGEPKLLSGMARVDLRVGVRLPIFRAAARSPGARRAFGRTCLLVAETIRRAGKSRNSDFGISVASYWAANDFAASRCSTWPSAVLGGTSAKD